MDCRNIEMSFILPPITNKTPAGTRTLEQLAQLIISPELKPQTEMLRCITDKATARSYKGQNLPYVTPAGVFSYCSDACLIKHSGVISFDFDDVADVDELKLKLIGDRNFFTVLAFRSPSGNGLKWFIVIDITKCDHKTWFHGVRNFLLATYHELTEKQVDRQCQNVSRACFLCYDPQAYVNLHSGTDPVCNFDPIAWAGKSAEVKKPATAANRQPNMASQPLHPLEELAKARATTRALLRIGANIADDYGDYLKLGFALANGLGSLGRELYHQLCSQSTKYREQDCERKWQQCLSHNDGRTTIATFYQMAKQAGVDLNSIARDYRYKPQFLY